MVYALNHDAATTCVTGLEPPAARPGAAGPVAAARFGSRSRDDVAEMQMRFPGDILHLDTKWPVGKRTKGVANRSGQYTDAWGCTWQLGPRGGRARCWPRRWPTPARLPRTNRHWSCWSRHGRPGPSRAGRAVAVRAGLERGPPYRADPGAVRPRGGPDRADRRPERDPPSARPAARLLRREIEMWAKVEVDGVVLGDTLATLEGLRLPLKTWQPSCAAALPPVLRDPPRP